MNHPSLISAGCLFALAFGSELHAETKLEAFYKKQAEMVQRAGIERALSKEMPKDVADLPIFGTIDWQVREMPFVAAGPKAGVSGMGFVALNGQLFLLGGFIPAGDETEEVSRRTSHWAYRYDPAADRWTRLPDLPARREYTRALAAGTSVYLLGGGAQMRPFQPYADVFQLDLSQDPLRWQSLAPMSVPRTHLGVGVVGQSLLAVGGNRYDPAEKGMSPKTIQGVTESFDLTKPEAGWQTRAPIPGAPRGWSASAVAGGKFYLLGGVTWNETGRVKLQETLCYEPAADRWTRRADPPFPISGWEADTYRDRYLLLVGGVGKLWNDVPFVYDTQTDRWMRMKSPLPLGGLCNDCGVVVIGDTIYVAGGEGPGGSHFNELLIGKIRAAE